MNNDEKNYRDLSSAEKRVILLKGTEMPFTGEYNNLFEKGTYICKRCSAPLYNSDDKFKSECGWPSFDDEIKGAVKRIPDKDGIRIEIECANCGAHLGHIFEGEGYTDKNIRHCVNSISMVFVSDISAKEKKAYFAGGCFWGVEYFFENKEGVISAVSGYMGGTKENPSYKDVCGGASGHYESVEVTYNPEKISYEELAKLFFEIHDPTQNNGQGPDIGEQYKSVIFVNDEEEKKTAEILIDLLKTKGYEVATKVLSVTNFYKAEEYHQDYYENNNKKPYCHIYTKRF